MCWESMTRRRDKGCRKQDGGSRRDRQDDPQLPGASSNQHWLDACRFRSRLTLMGLASKRPGGVGGESAARTCGRGRTNHFWSHDSRLLYE